MSISKRRAVIEVFGPIPLDRENLDWLYRRRHLGTVRDGAWRDLAYVVECDNLETAIRNTLDLIRRRDGARIANEVAGRLADSLAHLSGAPASFRRQGSLTLSASRR